MRWRYANATRHHHCGTTAADQEAMTGARGQPGGARCAKTKTTFSQYEHVKNNASRLLNATRQKPYQIRSKSFN